MQRLRERVRAQPGGGALGTAAAAVARHRDPRGALLVRMLGLATSSRSDAALGGVSSTPDGSVPIQVAAARWRPPVRLLGTASHARPARAVGGLSRTSDPRPGWILRQFLVTQVMLDPQEHCADFREPRMDPPPSHARPARALADFRAPRMDPPLGWILRLMRSQIARRSRLGGQSTFVDRALAKGDSRRARLDGAPKED